MLVSETQKFCTWPVLSTTAQICGVVAKNVTGRPAWVVALMGVDLPTGIKPTVAAVYVIVCAVPWTVPADTIPLTLIVTLI